MATSTLKTDFRGSIEVTADGVKTYKALLNELWALIDWDKVSIYAKLLMISSSTNYAVMSVSGFNKNNTVRFGCNSHSECWGVLVHSSLSQLRNYAYAGTVTTFDDNVMPSGQKFTIYY